MVVSRIVRIAADEEVGAPRRAPRILEGEDFVLGKVTLSLGEGRGEGVISPP